MARLAGAVSFGGRRRVQVVLLGVYGSLGRTGIPGLRQYAGTSLLDVTEVQPLGHWVNVVNETFAVDTNHEYAIQMWADNIGTGVLEHRAALRGTIEAIPAPGSAALGLIGLGMIALLTRRLP